MSFLKEYTLLGELGTGGFAKVYKVRHNTLGYIRAIRVLNEPVTDENSRTYQKFLRECKVLLRLGNGSHRNIVHIYQPRLLENHALVEMDYVDGKDISHYLNENGNFLPIDEVLHMVEEISSALAYCHEDIYKFCMDPDDDQLESDPVDGSKWIVDDVTRKRLIEKYKVIHNDIHSGNIMRREDGSFVLLDFGLAITGEDDVRNSSRHENGAVEFKAPEKWDDDCILTEQSDIYSFGVVMYEYLAGRVPFPYDKTNSNRIKAAFLLGEAHKSQMPPSIFELRKANYENKNTGKIYEKDYPEWLEEAIMKCLEKDPSRRFRSGKELYEFICKHDDAKNTTLLSKNQLLTEEISQLKEERKNAEERISMLFRENQSLYDSISTITAEKQKLENQHVESQIAEDKKIEVQNDTQQPNERPNSKKKKKNMVPWIVAAGACLVLVAVLLPKIFKNDNAEIIAINESFESANQTLSQQIEARYSAFEEQYGLDQEKIGSYWEQAQALKTAAEEIVDQADYIKCNMIYNKANRSFIHEQDELLYTKCQKFFGLLNSQLPVYQVDPKASLPCNVAILNGIILETKTKELEAVNGLLSDIHASDFTFNEISAKVFAESGYLLSGQTYKAQALVTGWRSSHLTARVKLDDGAEREYVSNARGVIPLEWNVGIGAHKYTGVIDMLDPATNQIEEFPFSGSFTVAPPAVSVSAVKMNVVYRGIDNPIVVGGGIGGEITATSTNATLTKTGNGTYNLRPGEGNEVTLNVSSDGSNLGCMKFRVKDLPKPTALIRNVVNGQVSKSALLTANKVEAETKDFDFDGVHYDVVGYTFRYKTKAGTAKEAKASSSAFTDEIKNAISAANVGDVFVFTAIQVRGNDGKTKTLDTPIGVEIK